MRPRTVTLHSPEVLQSQSRLICSAFAGLNVSGKSRSAVPKPFSHAQICRKPLWKQNEAEQQNLYNTFSFAGVTQRWLPNLLEAGASPAVRHTPFIRQCFLVSSVHQKRTFGYNGTCCSVERCIDQNGTICLLHRCLFLFVKQLATRSVCDKFTDRI